MQTDVISPALEERYAGAKGLNIFMRSWLPAGPPRGVVVVVHGFNSHSGYYSWVAQQFVDSALAVYAEVAHQLAHHTTDEDLTRREVEVLSLIAAGNSNRLIADQLSISEETVKVHVSSIMSKLAVSGRTHAVTLALKRGIIHL